MIIKEKHRVPEGINGVRFSDYARTAFPAIPSRKGVSKAIKRGELWIDGTPARSGDWVRAGQTLEWVDLQRQVPKTYRLPLEVVFEDDWLAVVNKPPGIEVSGNKFKTLENALAGSLSASTQPDALGWPRPVHRLDYSTSGLLLVAKTSGAQVFLGRQFEARAIRKRYCAVVMGRLSGAGQVDEPVCGQPSHSEYVEGNRFHHFGAGISPGSIDVPPKFGSLLKREQTRWEKFNPPPS